MKSPRGSILPPLLSLLFPQYFHPSIEPSSPHLSPLLLGKHAVSAPQVPGPQAAAPAVLLPLLVVGWAVMHGVFLCGAGAAVQGRGRGVLERLRDLVCGQVPQAICISERVSHLCLTAEVLHSTQPPLSPRHRHTHKHTKYRHLQTQKGY